MNKQFGAIVRAIAATLAVAISLVGCSSVEAMKSSSEAVNGKDLIYVWSDLSMKKGLRADNLDMKGLFEVRQEYREQYGAVGKVGNRCIVKIWNLNEYRHARAEVSNRWSDSGFNYTADTGWDFMPVSAIILWIRSQVERCTTQPL